MNFSKLESLLKSLPHRGYPYCGMAVTLNGKPVFRHTVGYSDAEGKRPASPRDLYWIFSASKVITCTAAMQLVERGIIALDDPVSKYIPAYADLKVKNPDGTCSPSPIPMTVEHLFTMTGGLTYELNSPSLREARKDPHASTLTLVSAMAKEPLEFVPGTRHRYSLCHDVLAAVVEVASGMRFSDYMQKNLFDPLGMTDTGFRPTEEQLSRFASAWRHDDSTGRSTLIPTENPYALSLDYDSGGAGLFSSVDDYIKLVTALACDGVGQNGTRILSPETIAMMEVDPLTPEARKSFIGSRLYGYSWGLCGRVHVDPAYSLARSPVGEFGWDGAANAFALVDRKNHLALFFGTQVHASNYGYHLIHPLLRDLTYEGLESN